MFSAFELGIKYLRYVITASNGQGHGVHSPFVFNLIQRVFIDYAKYDAYDKIETKRKALLNNATLLTIEDFGAGSTVMKSNTRRVRDIARSSLKPKKYGQLLFRLVAFFQPATVLELGTSLGITTSYLATANPAGKVITFEGATQVAAQARGIFESLGLNNVTIVEGNFDDTLAQTLRTTGKIDFAFVDGNHRHEPTVRYFRELLGSIHEESVVVFDDIHWSHEMEAAWEQIKQDASVTLSIDLFFIGLVFFRKEHKVKQHFTIRY